jgi:hypothetical protein
MRCMLMLYDNDAVREAFFGPGGAPLGRELQAVMDELRASGELIATDPLADPAQTKVVRVGQGVPMITDGPLAEAKECFAGYLIVECDTPERALEIAARWPSAPYGAAVSNGADFHAKR